jgi:hypothetical protein
MIKRWRCHLQAHARYGRVHPMADYSGHSPALAHREADARSEEREAELHDDRVRLGPSAALHHEADASIVVAAVLIIPEMMQQLGIGALEDARAGRAPIGFSGEEQRLANWSSGATLARGGPIAIGECWRARRRRDWQKLARGLWWHRRSACGCARHHALQVARSQREGLAAHAHLVPPARQQPADVDSLAVQLRAGLEPRNDGGAAGETFAGGADILRRLRRQLNDGEDEAAAAGDGALEGRVGRVVDGVDKLAEGGW